MLLVDLLRPNRLVSSRTVLISGPFFSLELGLSFFSSEEVIVHIDEVYIGL